MKRMIDYSPKEVERREKGGKEGKKRNESKKREEY